MQKGELIFVYGTLRQGERADLRKQSHNFGVSFVSKDKINGELYHLGAFPGVKTVQTRFNLKQPVVVGEVFVIREAAIVALLDAYEGYNADAPTKGLYDRIQTQSERHRTVWVYVYNGPVIPDQLIDGGDWCRSREMNPLGRRLAI